jgi:HEPN domain-containing protein
MKEFEKWFKKAENDLLSIRNKLASEEIPIDACCFHAQQTAEKYLKAFLVFKSVSFPKTHDLQALTALCAKINPIFHELKEPALKLSDFGIAPRYPDDFDDLTLEDSQQAFQNALLIKNFVLKHFIG